MRFDVNEEPDVEGFTEWAVPDGEDSDPERAGPKIRSIAEIASIRTYAARKIEFVVDGVIATGTVMAITGESGDGKTTVATFPLKIPKRASARAGDCRGVSGTGDFSGKL